MKSFNFKKYSQNEYSKIQLLEALSLKGTNIPNLQDKLKELGDEDQIKSLIFKEFGLNYSKEAERFLSAKRQSFVMTKSLLSNADVETINLIINNERELSIQQYVKKLEDLFIKYQAEYQMTREEFAHFCQAGYNKGDVLVQIGNGSFRERLKIEKNPKITDPRELQIHKECVNIIQTFTALNNDSPFGRYISGYFLRFKQENLTKRDLNREEKDKELFEAIQSRPELINSTSLKPFTQTMLLQAAKLDESIYPLKSSEYWGIKNYNDLTEEEKSNLLNKVRTLIESAFPDSKNLSSILEAHEKDLFRQEEKLFRSLYRSVAEFDDVILAQILYDALNESAGYGGERNDEQTNDVILATQTKNKYPDEEFAMMNFKFDSREEQTIVEIFRKEFNIQCVPSDLRIPIINDNASKNVNFFKVDFILYCNRFDGMVFDKEKKINIPKISATVVLIGEYFGYNTKVSEGLNKEKLKADVLDIDGSILTVDTPKGPLELKAGAEAGSSVLYEIKSRYKKMTEDFMASITNSNTISIHAIANNRAKAREEIINGLETNNIIYNPIEEIKSLIPTSSSIYILEKWFKDPNIPIELKQNPDLLKFVNINTLEILPGTEFKENKYESLIIASLHKLKAQMFNQVVAEDRTSYNRKNLYDYYSKKQALINKINLNKEEYSILINKNQINEANNKLQEINHLYYMIDQMGSSNSTFTNLKNKYDQKIKFSEDYLWRENALRDLIYLTKNHLVNDFDIKMIIDICTDLKYKINDIKPFIEKLNLLKINGTNIENKIEVNKDAINNIDDDGLTNVHIEQSLRTNSPITAPPIVTPPIVAPPPVVKPPIAIPPRLSKKTFNLYKYSNAISSHNNNA